MSSRGWVFRAVLGAIGWAWLGLAPAQAGSILPTEPTTGKLIGTASVTLSLYQLDSGLPAASTLTLSSPSRCTTSGTTDTTLYKDVTDCWLPEWDPISGVGKSVFVVVNGSTAAPALVQPAAATFPLLPGAANPFVNPLVAALTTSAYPGQCTNFGAGNEPDFTLTVPSPQPSLKTSTGPVTGTVYELKPNDCGGMAVIQVGSFKFIVPRDGTTTVAANGIPEVWENLYGGNLDPAGDIDTGPAAASPVSDGISTFDEYRGFIVSKKQVRTDPRQKDVFLHLMNPAPTCPSGSLLGGGTITYPTTSPIPTLPTGSLFANVYALVPSDRVHLLGYTPGAMNGKTDEWLDSFTSLTPPQTLNPATDPVADRTVNPNRVYGPAQKGIRVMECLDTSSASVLGWAYGVASPNDAGNVVVYTQRIVNYINGLINAAPSSVKYSTFLNGAWNTTLVGAATASATDPVRNFIISKAIQFILGMEVLHSVDLTASVQSTSKVTYGHHFAPSTGDCLDQAMTNDPKGNTFYIPSVCGTADQTQLLLK